ncbi:MAG: ferrous iron transport protein B [Fimbriimonadaceae bacterium]|nr:ferrous iron transport protein B [Fimbriimonadaceae bacterium]
MKRRGDAGLVTLDALAAERIVALAGNPNVGKSCVFNQLTGLRQHVGNWPGKTVQRAEGRFMHAGRPYKMVDLPGTYSLLSTSTDEEIARDFLLFGRPDVTIVVIDATALERNLNLVLQVLEITDRVVVCLNLVDEARRKGLVVDAAQLSRELGVPVIPTVANAGQGLDEVVATVAAVAAGQQQPAPLAVPAAGELLAAADRLAPMVDAAIAEVSNARWIALRLLEGDPRVREAVATGELERQAGELAGRLPDHDQGEGAAHGHPHFHSHAHGDRGAGVQRPQAVAQLLAAADAERANLAPGLLDDLVGRLYATAAEIAGRCVTQRSDRRRDLDLLVDRLVTSRTYGFGLMLLLLGLVFWLTISGANVVSAALARGLFALEAPLAGLGDWLGAPWWLTGVLVHGAYRALAWVIAVMLPPMAIFFPLFTLLEDLGYLPRVAFNLDRFFRAANAHGKQSLTMAMGFGCNAAGVTACRIIDSPRERLIAVITNNFVPCNGRWPTLLMLSAVFVAPLASPGVGALAGAATLVGVVLFAVATTLCVSALLSRSVLRGEASAFALEMPSYRRPRIWQVLYTSLIDRTLFVLWRAMIFAVPAGLVIWILGNVAPGGVSLFEQLAGILDPLGRAIGLDGVILLAYVVAIPANEIVVPTIFMGYNVLSTTGLHAGQRVMVELESLDAVRHLLVDQQGWTLLTAVCLILFVVLHNPCSTTIWTIYRETKSVRWTALATFLPLALGFAVCFLVAQTARLLGWA